MLKMRRLKKCLTNGCNELGICHSGCCLRCTRGFVTWPRPKPTHKNPFGLELEYYAGHDRGLVSKLVGHTIDDCSLDEDGHESKFCEDADELARVVAERIRALKHYNAWVDDSCGLHVHMSGFPLVHGEERDNQRILEKKLGQVLYNIQDHLFRKVFPQRDTEYCEPIQRDYYLDGWIYPTGYSTMECRIHESTLNPHAIAGWVEVCKGIQKLCKDVMAGRDTNTVKIANQGDLTKIFKPKSWARRYLEHRIDNRGMVRDFVVPGFE